MTYNMVDYVSANAEERFIREQKRHRRKYGEAVDEVICRARASGARETMEVIDNEMFESAEVYAYPFSQGDRSVVTWGITKRGKVIRDGRTSPGGGAEFPGCD